MKQTINNEIKSFLDKNFSERHHNTVYTTLALASVLLMAAWGEMQDYISAFVAPKRDAVMVAGESVTRFCSELNWIVSNLY